MSIKIEEKEEQDYINKNNSKKDIIDKENERIFINLSKINNNHNHISQKEKKIYKKEENIHSEELIKLTNNLNELFKKEDIMKNEIITLEKIKLNLEESIKQLKLRKKDEMNKLQGIKEKIEKEKSFLIEEQRKINKEKLKLQNEKEKAENAKKEINELELEFQKYYKRLKQEEEKFKNEKEIFNNSKSLLLKNEIKEKKVFQGNLKICKELNFNSKFPKEEINKRNKNQMKNEVNNKKNNNENNTNEEKTPCPKGLKNIGLSCYINSLLQCLFYIKKFRKYFIKEKDNFEGQPVCKALSKIMCGLKDNDKYFTTSEFKKIMGERNDLFSGIKAGDSKDLYLNLIDLILNELSIKNDKNNLMEFNKDEYKTNESEEIKMFLKIKKEIDENIINNLFIGFYEIIYKCTNLTNHCSISFNTESFILFNLEKISNYFNNNELNIEDCFEYNFNKRYSSSFYCNYCKKIEENMAEDKIYIPPKILVIILDRGKGKLFKGKVIFDNNLDLNNYIVDKNYQYNSNYTLICVLSHSGPSSSRGHYTSSCLTDNGKCYYFSDDFVKEIDNPLVYDGEPYLLFYKRNKT